jgi:hypothetical protein
LLIISTTTLIEAVASPHILLSRRVLLVVICRLIVLGVVTEMVVVEVFQLLLLLAPQALDGRHKVDLALKELLIAQFVLAAIHLVLVVV